MVDVFFYGMGFYGRGMGFMGGDGILWEFMGVIHGRGDDEFYFLEGVAA